MKKNSLLVCAVQLATFLLGITFSVEGYSKAPPIFVPEKPAHVTLKNGIEIFFIENHELPVIDTMLYIKGGSVYDPQGKEGLSQLMIQALRLGGSDKKSPEDIEESLERVSATLEMGVQSEFYTATLSLLQKDFSSGLSILISLLKNPTFQKDRFELVKSHILEGLEREKEEPFSYANKEFYKMIYQNDASRPHNVWGRFSSVDTVKKLSHEEVVAFYKNNICPDRMVFAIAGDTTFNHLVSRLEKETTGWTRCGSPLSPLDPVREIGEKNKEKVLKRPDLTQSSILVGHLGTNRFNPDKYALQVMNFLLGGGGALNSRMGEEIRSNAGKAYMVYSDFGFGKDKGVFRLIAQTAVANTDWVVKKIKEMVAALHEGKDGKATFEEVELAKKGILRSLMFDFETPFAQVKEQARFALLGYPENYIENFQKEIRQVSVSDVQRVAQEYLKPEELATLVVTTSSRPSGKDKK